VEHKTHCKISQHVLKRIYDFLFDECWEKAMAGRKQVRLKLATESEASEAPPRRSNRVNLFELAYERIEHLIVTCELKPGRFLSIQDLQEITGFSRTPAHQAVSRLADDTLILIKPRHGVQIAPIDLARERMGRHTAISSCI
jgi:DNA-binding transcriptional regulator YhcF (GntR family)